MHRYECGLPNIFLRNGYRVVETPYGRGIAVENVEGLHRAIASTLVRERVHLTGPEVRFVRKYLEMTQSQLAALLGVEEQSVRRWEKLPRVPKPADRAVRLLFLDQTRGKIKTPTLASIVKQVESAGSDPAVVRFQFRPRAREKWMPLAA